MDKTIKVYCDGGARGNPGPAAAAFVVVSPGGQILAKRGFFLGRATNNMAEYEAVARALSWLARSDGIERVRVLVDSQLIAGQLTGRFRIREEKLRALATKIKNLEARLTAKINYQTISRTQNRLADFLVNQTLDAVKR